MLSADSCSFEVTQQAYAAGLIYICTIAHIQKVNMLMCVTSFRCKKLLSRYSKSAIPFISLLVPVLIMNCTVWHLLDATIAGA